MDKSAIASQRALTAMFNTIAMIRELAARTLRSDFEEAVITHLPPRERRIVERAVDRDLNNTDATPILAIIQQEARVMQAEVLDLNFQGNIRERTAERAILCALDVIRFIKESQANVVPFHVIEQQRAR
jgi:hypothetical protein